MPAPGPLLLDLSSTTLSNLELELITHPIVGGIVLFSRNYESVTQLRAMLQQILTIRPDIVIMVDQEGGSVQRFVHDFPPIASMREFGTAYAAQDSKSYTRLVQELTTAMFELANVGVSVNLAPVVDLQDNEQSFLYSRSISSDAGTTVTIAEQLIKIMHASGIKSTLKHFPGHGKVLEDSHLALPIDTRQQAEIVKSDIQPFQALAHLTDAIMPGHVLYPEVDAKLPASLSETWQQSILRNKIGFKGAIISDDLSMSALDQYASIVARAELALTAGCDYLCVCNNQASSIKLIDHLHSCSALINGPDGKASLRRQALAKGG